jgi:hypothetical protein
MLSPSGIIADCATPAIRLSHSSGQNPQAGHSAA